MPGQMESGRAIVLFIDCVFQFFSNLIDPNSFQYAKFTN